MITVNVTSTSLTATADKILTDGLVGENCRFTFSSEWDDLMKEAVFEGSHTITKVLFTDETVVPPEVFDDAAGYNFRIAVTGRNANGIVVIPTIWAKVGKIQASGAEYTGRDYEPTPDIVTQIEREAADAKRLASIAYTAYETGEMTNAAVQESLKAVNDRIEDEIAQAIVDLETSLLSFEVEEDGYLYMNKSSKMDVNFSLNEEGELIYEQ